MQITRIFARYCRIPAGEGIDDIQPLARVQIVDGPLAVDLERVVVDRDVDRAPPDVVLRVGMLDDALVLRRAAGLFAREGDQRPGIGDVALRVLANRLGIELRRRKIAADVLDGDAVLRQVKRFGLPGCVGCWLLERVVIAWSAWPEILSYGDVGSIIASFALDNVGPRRNQP